LIAASMITGSVIGASPNWNPLQSFGARR
jgi:hypothetical protein